MHNVDRERERVRRAIPRIQAAKARGETNDEVARAAGAHRATFYRWIRRGENGEEPYADLARAFHEARRDLVNARIREITAKFGAVAS
jgi:transposase